AYAVADLCHMAKVDTLRYLSELREVPGRFQRVMADSRGRLGIVDYAHTPDAVDQVTKAASDIVRDDGGILIALGCGGNRDRTERPEMASAAARNADIVILTSEKPRNEDPDQIIADMFEELTPPPQATVFPLVDRREAIR